MRWFSERDLLADARVRLFCFPHAGSGAAGFYRWKRLLPPWIAVCPVLLPGRETRFAEPLATSVDEIVAALRAEWGSELANRPFAFYGHSMGSLLAYEGAGTLPREGPGAPLALFVSGRDAPTESAAVQRLHTLTDAALVDALRLRYGQNGVGLLDDPELRDLFLPIVRADLRVVESYRAAAGTPLHCPVRAFAGEADTSVSGAGLAGWAAVSRGPTTVRRLEGDHFFHFGAGQAELLRTLVEELSALVPPGS